MMRFWANCAFIWAVWTTLRVIGGDITFEDGSGYWWTWSAAVAASLTLLWFASEHRERQDKIIRLLEEQKQRGEVDEHGY
ncbi:hypothetical protein PBI_DEWDROP_113 [Microbacterium phage Dewdrop]|nr:hypothetical protein PBI_LEAF_113 [Microbacterium phage Leaf]QGZ17481.1 hypothetical protein PBI_DEWDROP_113 [Microbacterium phage Dewdrop]